jgi:hypothetical protein
MEDKAACEMELADPSIHQAGEKTRLLKTLERQKQLADEENRLIGEWDRLSLSIDAYSSQEA